MITGIGVDLCSIERIKRALRSEQFRGKIFSREEISYAERKNTRRYESYAACFAAREAFSKASGIPLMSVMDGENFSLAHDDNGKPQILISSELAEKFGFNAKIFVSLTHEEGYACAMVVIENL